MGKKASCYLMGHCWSAEPVLQDEHNREPDEDAWETPGKVTRDAEEDTQP